MAKVTKNGDPTKSVKDRIKRGSWTDGPARADKDATHLAAMESKAAAPAGKPIVLPELDIQQIRLRLVGDAPLITNQWSDKARKMMRDKQTGEASAGKENKVPENDFRASLYLHPQGGYGFPTIAFKNAAVAACTSLGKSVTKVAARQAFHVMGELALIEGDEPVMREDMVRIGMGTADIRYRGMFNNWSTELIIRFNARLLSAAQLCNLFNTAGFAVGVGEWRPECNGSFGLFHVGRGGRLMERYVYKPGSRFRVSAQVVGERLEGIKARLGRDIVPAAEVVEDARAPDSPLHVLFDWDDAHAAEQHRLAQARQLIRSVYPIHVDSEGNEKPVLGWINAVVPDVGRGYVSTARAVSEPELYEQVLANALAELGAIQRRYQNIVELSDVWREVDRVVLKVRKRTRAKVAAGKV